MRLVQAVMVIRSADKGYIFGSDVFVIAEPCGR